MSKSQKHTFGIDPDPAFQQQLEEDCWFNCDSTNDELTRNCFSSIIVGAQYYEPSAYDALRAGSMLVLKHEPENVHDVHAIAVITAEDQRIGYLPRKDAEYLACALTFLRERECVGIYDGKRVQVPFLPAPPKRRAPSRLANSLDECGDFDIGSL